MGKVFDRDQFRADLKQFTGTEQWYKTAFPGYTYTDGVKFVAETCGAYWMIDYVVSYQGSTKSLQGEDFQTWYFEKDEDRMKVIVEDGNNRVLMSSEIEYTDFPDSKIELWMVGGVILLPSEY